MEQRQLRLGDTLDDYCPRERRLTNHSVVAMVGADVKQTRCATCETEHEYKHAKVPRQRRKSDTPAALYAQVAATAPKRAGAIPDARPRSGDGGQSIAAADAERPSVDAPASAPPLSPAARAADEAGLVDGDTASMGGRLAGIDAGADERGDAGHDEDARDEEGRDGEGRDEEGREEEEGPVHRQLIRASLPREGQPPVSRPIPEFTIRQPTGGGRPGRFRPQQHSRGQEFQGNRSNGNNAGGQRGGGPRPAGRPPQGGASSRPARRHGPGRNRPK